LIRYKHNLRTRVVVAFALTGALIGSLFAVAAYWVGGIIELRFIEDTLGEELSHYIDQIVVDPQARLIPTRLQGYVTASGEEDRLPVYLTGLSPGLHERYEGDREYHVAVQDRNGKRFYLVYDATHIEYWETLLQAMLPISALGITCLAFCLGRWLSARVLAPVTRLAKEVRLLHDDPNAGHGISIYGGDEVGDLAREFDRLIQRLWAFAKREAEFTADVSHELRTPVAVVRTTTELLLSKSQIDERLRPPLNRLDRAGRQMSNLIDVFLMIARESEPSREEVADTWPLEPVIREILDARKEDLEHKRLTVELETNGHLEVTAPRVVLIVVFGNLLGNAITYTQNGRIRITLDEQGAAVEDTGVGIAEIDQPHIFQRAYRGRQPVKSGSGFGLAIVHRLCQRYGWRVGVDSTKGQGTRIWLAFSPDSPL
jgi:signal transduction histidine kinase